MFRFYVVLINSFFAQALFEEKQKHLRAHFSFIHQSRGLEDYVESFLAGKRPFVRNLGPIHLSESVSNFTYSSLQLESSYDEVHDMLKVLERYRRYPTQWSKQFVETEMKGFWPHYHYIFGMSNDGDMSVSHIPWSVELRRRIKLDRKSAKHLAGLLSLDRIPSTNVRNHIHIFPYGIVNLITTLSVSTAEPPDTAALGRAIQWLGGRTKSIRNKPSFVMPGKGLYGSLNYLTGYMINQLGHSLFNTGPEPLIKESEFVAVHLEEPPRHLSDLDAYRLMAQIKGEERPEKLRTTAGDGESVFGKYKADRILISNRGMLVVTRRSMQCSSDRKFFWRLLSVAELAINQKVVFKIVATLFRKSQIIPIEIKQSIRKRLSSYAKQFLVKERTFKIVLHLLFVHENLPSSYRKWYYISSDALGVKRRRATLHSSTQQLMTIEMNWSAPVARDIKTLWGLLSAVK